MEFSKFKDDAPIDAAARNMAGGCRKGTSSAPSLWWGRCCWKLSEGFLAGSLCGCWHPLTLPSPPVGGEGRVRGCQQVS